MHIISVGGCVKVYVEQDVSDSSVLYFLMGAPGCGRSFTMAKDYARSFYSSEAWNKTREAYRKSAGGLCERCLAKGIYTPGEIVHHKQPLTAENINDSAVTLGWSNLELVCRECHAEAHGKRKKRYEVDALGRVTAPR